MPTPGAQLANRDAGSGPSCRFPWSKHDKKFARDFDTISVSHGIGMLKALGASARPHTRVADAWSARSRPA